MNAAVTTTNPKPRLASDTSFRFQKTNRLLDAPAFGRVFKKAARSRDKLFTVLCRTNNEEHARLGLAISKKHCRKASTRNRIKRIIRESFRHNKEQLSELDIVVINQPAAALSSNEAIADSLLNHWHTCVRKTR